MNRESQKFIEKAQHAIRAAEILLAKEETEFAAGRAYYAMR